LEFLNQQERTVPEISINNVERLPGKSFTSPEVVTSKKKKTQAQHGTHYTTWVVKEKKDRANGSQSNNFKL
jgi:hypothetical protein